MKYVHHLKYWIENPSLLGVIYIEVNGRLVSEFISLSFPGFLLDKKIGVNQPKRIENAKILIANTSMDADKIKVSLICLSKNFFRTNLTRCKCVVVLSPMCRFGCRLTNVYSRLKISRPNLSKVIKVNLKFFIQASK